MARSASDSSSAEKMVRPQILVFSASERVPCATRCDDRSTLPVNLDVSGAREIALEAGYPPALPGQKNEDVGSVGRLRFAPPRGQQAIAFAGRIAGAHAIA